MPRQENHDKNSVTGTDGGLMSYRMKQRQLST